MYSHDAAALAQIANGNEVPVSYEDLFGVIFGQLNAVQDAVIRVAEALDASRRDAQN